MTQHRWSLCGCASKTCTHFYRKYRGNKMRTVQYWRLSRGHIYCDYTFVYIHWVTSNQHLYQSFALAHTERSLIWTETYQVASSSALFGHPPCKKLPPLCSTVPLCYCSLCYNIFLDISEDSETKNQTTLSRAATLFSNNFSYGLIFVLLKDVIAGGKPHNQSAI